MPDDALLDFAQVRRRPSICNVASHCPVQEHDMEPQDNKQLALQKALSSHEQAAAGLTDLTSILDEERYDAMTARIDQNIAELRAEAERHEDRDAP
jgi:hypothetical protein